MILTIVAYVLIALIAVSFLAGVVMSRRPRPRTEADRLVERRAMRDQRRH